MNPIILLLAIPFFVLLIGMEVAVVWRKRKSYYRLNDAITNLCIGVGNQAFNLFFKALLLGGYMLVFQNFALWELPANVGTFFLALVGFDFFFYWAHRWSHELNFWWGAHVVHHQSEEFNLSVALRQSWFHNLFAFFLFLPLPILGFDPVMFFVVAATHTLYQFWIHTKLIGKLWKPIEFIFNTPSHHRVHHGRDPKYIDKNHAGVFIIFDRLFGTFQEEEEEPTYGITTPLKSWNPGWANIHYYVEMIQKMRLMRTWRDRLKMIWARPGWQPEYLGGMQHAPEIDEQAKRKYDTTSSLGINLYVVLNFALLTIGLGALMYYFDGISLFYKLCFFGIILLSTFICGAMLEGRSWVKSVEYIRLGLILASLNSFYYYWKIDWFEWMVVGSGIGFVILFAFFTYVALFKPMRRPAKVQN